MTQPLDDIIALKRLVGEAARIILEMEGVLARVHQNVALTPVCVSDGWIVAQDGEMYPKGQTPATSDLCGSGRGME